MGALVAVVVVVAWGTRRYTGTVANFLAAGRCANRYIIAVGEGFGGFAAIGVVANFEMYYKGGFSILWWGLIMLAASLVAYMSGWLVCRFRETRAFTIAQFLEERYSRRFRIFAGGLAWFSGIVNFGLFPAVGARFFIYFCGLPEWNVTILGFPLSLTYALIMLFLLGMALWLIFVGGQVAVIVTDFVQGMFCNIAFVIIVSMLLFGMFRWPTIVEGLSFAPPNESLLNPFKSSSTKDFNVWYYLIAAFGLFYGLISWQGTQGFRAAAINPHEARMGMTLNTWRSFSQNLGILVLPLCAYVYMHHPDFAAGAERVKATLSMLPSETLRTQMTVPVALNQFLPSGMLGLLGAVMLAAFIGNHNSYLHSWGSIFVQDVILPLRKTPPGAAEHLRWLKISIAGVAGFIFLFSLFYQQNEYILMFFAFTGTLFLGGAGAVVIGGLYWKRGTTTAAWVALTNGLMLAIAGAVTRRVWPDFPVNSMWMFFIAMVSSTALYVVVSLLGRTQFNLDKLLHRGAFATAGNQAAEPDQPVRGFRALIGMGREFTFWDKVIYLSSVAWTLVLVAVFVVGTVVSLAYDVADAAWARFWWIYLVVHLVISAVTTVWFVIGGTHGMLDLYRRLRTLKPDDRDDGRVEGGN